MLWAGVVICHHRHWWRVFTVVSSGVRLLDYAYGVHAFTCMADPVTWPIRWLCRWSVGAVSTGPVMCSLTEMSVCTTQV